MSDKYWKMHVVHIINGEIKPLSVLAGEQQTGRHGGRPIAFGLLSTPAKDTSQLKTQQLIKGLTNITEGKIGKEINMEAKESNIDRMIDRLTVLTGGLAEEFTDSGDQPIDVVREKKLFDLGLKFLEAASRCDVELAKAYVGADFHINFQHPATKRTALHNAAAYTACEFVRLLVNTDKCNYLIRDAKGRLAYDVAYELGHDMDIANLLREKTIQQAEREGVSLDAKFL